MTWDAPVLSWPIGVCRVAWDLDARASQLPYGTKKRLGIGVALMRNPALLLLDEPAAGLNTKETVDLVQDLQRINRDGVTMIVVEHNMPLIMAVSDRIVVLDHGVKIAEGLPKKSLQTNK